MDYTWCLQTLQRIQSDLAMYTDGRALDTCVLDVHASQLHLVYRELVAAELLGYQVSSTLLDCVRQSVQIVNDVIERYDNGNMPTSSYQAQLVLEETPGHPRFDILYSQLLSMLELRFSMPQISKILGVSVRTIRRRMSLYSLHVRDFYSNMSDSELDAVVDIKSRFPSCGNRQMQGHFQARGIRVQQCRVRESQRRVDPSGCAMRRLRSINRRNYQVNGPLALWHMDGNHKLIRYIRILL